MWLMRRTLASFAAMVGGFLLLLPAEFSYATICILVPIKPIRHVCGIVTNRLGEPIQNAKVTILKEATELASAQTSEDGKFSFEQLESGNYNIRVQADHYNPTQSPIVLVKPAMKCKQALEVVLAVGTSCSSVGLAKR